MFDGKQIFFFSSYVVLFTVIAMLVTYSKNSDGNYDYDIFTVNFMTEGTKWVLAFILLNSQLGWGNFKSNTEYVISQAQYGVWFFIPAFIYFISNGMTFVNLRLFDPTTVRIFSNMRVLTTGVLFQIFFNKKLGAQKWFALVLLVIGCFVTRFGDQLEYEGLVMLGSLFFQCLLSSLGGVSFEFLLKKDIKLDNIMVQNLYLYTATCSFNLLWIGVMRPKGFSSFEDFFEGFSITVFFIIIVGGCAGVGVSFLLKYLNVIYKEYANAVEMLTTAIASAVLFGIPIYWSTIIGIIIVSISLYLYNKEEVKVVKPAV